MASLDSTHLTANTITQESKMNCSFPSSPVCRTFATSLRLRSHLRTLNQITSILNQVRLQRTFTTYADRAHLHFPHTVPFCAHILRAKPHQTSRHRAPRSHGHSRSRLHHRWRHPPRRRFHAAHELDSGRRAAPLLHLRFSNNPLRLDRVHDPLHSAKLRRG